MTYYVYDNRVFDDQDDVRDYRIDNPGGTTQRFDTLAQANAFLSDSRSSFGRDEIPSGDDIVEAQRLMDAFLTGEGMAEAAYSLWGEETLEEILDRVMAQNTQIAPADREAVRSNLGFVIEQARNEAQNIVDTMVDNPEALADMEDPGPLVTSLIEAGAQSFAGTPVTTATPPASTSPGAPTGGEYAVITGGAGVTVSTQDILKTGGRIFGETVQTVQRDQEGNPVLDANGNPVVIDEYQPGILDAIIPYIPGISLPDWMPSAGVIFFPTVGEAVNKIEEVVAESGISEAAEDGSLGGILGAIGEIIVGAGTAAAEVLQEKVGQIIGGIVGAVTDPTRAGTIIGGVIGGSFPSIPSWLPPLITDPRVYRAARNVLTSNFSTPEDQFPPISEEVEQDPALMFTHRGDNYFVNKTEDEYFQLAESEDFAFELDGQYTREQLESTGLETVSSGSYQSLLDDYSFYALTEDIYEYPIEELVARYEAEGGILPDDWDLLDEESRYNFFIDDFRAVDDDDDDGVVTGPDPDPDPQPDPDPDPQPDPDPDPDPNDDDDTETDTSVIEGLFADFLAQMDEEFTGQQEQINQIIQNFVETLPDYNAMPTMEDIAEYFEVNGVNLSQQNFDRIQQELANAGYLTQDQLTEALAGVATPEQVQEAIQNAGFATPEQVMQYLAEAGYATPEDISNALANSGFVTEDRLLLALAEAGYATPEQVRSIVDNAISNIVIPEGATTEEVRQLIQEAIDGIPPGISLDDVSDVVNNAIANIEFPPSLSGDDVRSIVDSFGFATSADVQAGFADLNQRFDDAINGIATQFSDQEAEFLASITGLEASLIQSLAAVEGGLSAELEMLDRDLVSLREDVANRFDEYREFTTEQFELAASERQELQRAIIAANGDITQLSADMQQMFADFGGTISDLFAGVGVDIAALQAGQISQEEALDQLRTSLREQFSTAQAERQELQQAIIAVGGDVTQLSDDMMLRFQQQDQTIEELFAGTNVNIEALRQGQISQAEALEAYQQYTTEQFGQAQQERLDLAQEIISVGGQVENLSADSLQRFTELNLSLGDLENEFNVSFEALRDGQISQAEAFSQFRESVSTRLGLGEEEREEILRRQAEFERIYGEEQQELQEQITTGNLLTVLAGGGMFGGGAAPTRAPYKEFMKGVTYRPREAPELAIKTPAVDYNEEAQKLLMRTRRRGMLV